MRTFAEIDSNARPKLPFSNGTIGYAWTSHWCDRCTNDAAMRDGGSGKPDADGILGCPLLAVALLGKTPVEWFEQEQIQDYHCVEFRDQDGPGDTEPKPLPDPGGMDAMLPREPYTGALMFTANVPAREEVHQ